MFNPFIVTDYSAHVHYDEKNQPGTPTFALNLEKKEQSSQRVIFPTIQLCGDNRTPAEGEGIALDTPHGAAYLVDARTILHGVTRQDEPPPNQKDPTRISIVSTKRIFLLVHSSLVFWPFHYPAWDATFSQVGPTPGRKNAACTQKMRCAIS